MALNRRDWCNAGASVLVQSTVVVTEARTVLDTFMRWVGQGGLS